MCEDEIYTSIFWVPLEARTNMLANQFVSYLLNSFLEKGCSLSEKKKEKGCSYIELYSQISFIIKLLLVGDCILYIYTIK